MYKIIHTIAQGQDENHRVEIIYHYEGFKTEQEAQEYIDTECPHNGWHHYKIVEE